ncbi:MAG: hypothetical protein N2116_04465 [Armatimonadetes bacterium]|nr:hypothetical protein [Armatimonadota bacterium]
MVIDANILLEAPMGRKRTDGREEFLCLAADGEVVACASVLTVHGHSYRERGGKGQQIKGVLRTGAPTVRLDTNFERGIAGCSGPIRILRRR